MDRRRRSYQIECLENRNLLSAMHGPQSAIVSALRTKHVSVNGSFQGSFGPDQSGRIDFNGNGSASNVGSISVVGIINNNIATLKAGSKFTGSVSLYTGDVNVANFNLGGTAPKSLRSPIKLSFNGVGVSSALPHSLNGSATLIITSSNADGTGQYTLNFKVSGRK